MRSQALYRRFANCRLLLVAASVGMIAMVATTAAQAQTTITVDSTSDDTNSGHCTLREGINSANGAGGTGTCAAGSGPYTIQISPTGTIALSNSLGTLVVGTGAALNLTINGPTSSSSGITIDGGSVGGTGGVRVMQVASFSPSAPPNVTLNLNNLTIANGNAGSGGGGITNAGGGILNFGMLTVTNCIFSGNSAEGGGGIFQGNILTVTNSTFSGNNGGAGGGGGIYIASNPVTVTNSTFSNNSSSAVGGGIYNASGMVTVTNSTFSRNNGGLEGGGIASPANMMLTNCTFSGNIAAQGSAIFGGGGGQNVIFKGAILANPVTSSNCSGMITDGGYNISDDGSCGFSKTGTANNGDGVNPVLGAFGMNGGPTETFALLSGSPAIDAIPHMSCTDQASPTPNQITRDQRGDPRPDPEDGAKGPCDIGAYEFQDMQSGPFVAHGIGDNIIRLINPNGAANGNLAGAKTQTVCAMVYIFDDDQEMGECCGCPVSSAQLATFSVQHNLTSNWALQGSPEGGDDQGSLAIVAAAPNSRCPGQSGACNGGCDPTNLPGYSVTAADNLLGSITENQLVAPPKGGIARITEVALFDDGAGDPTNMTYLQNQCGALVGNGTGGGICNCPIE